MSKAGILDNVLLIGSWCAHLYSYYFSNQDYAPRIKTRDIDFLTSTKPRFPKRIDFEKLMEPLGFEISFFGKGFMKLESDELVLEFLTPEVGRHRETPIPLKEIMFNAQPLRHMSILWRNPIEVEIGGVKVSLPHPADYALQKLIAASNRKRGDKIDKDRGMAIEVLNALLLKGEKYTILDSFNSLSKNERKIVTVELEKTEYSTILDRNISK